jgi:hypothetical protein
MRTPVGLGLFLLVSFVSLPVAFAQPIVEAQANVQAPPPRQPMRYILANGNVLIGTEVGGDAEWLMIQTQNGVIQVRRTEISSMDYQVGQAGVAIMAPNQPPPVYMQQPPPRRRGRGLVIAGSILFGISYGLSALIGISVGHESPSAYWFLLPVAGPVVWAATVDCGSTDGLDDGCRAGAYFAGWFITLVQAAGMGMLIGGIAMGSSSDDPGQAEGGLRLAGHPLDIAPVLTPGYQGLALSSTF